MSAKDIQADQFQEEVLESKTPVLVDFWAPWCGPCRMMAPILDELAQDPDLKEKVKIMKINTDEPQNQNLAMLYQIRSIPNMKLFANGKVVKDFIGLRPKEQLKSELSQFID